jgi:hypothetical protein
MGGEVIAMDDGIVSVAQVLARTEEARDESTHDGGKQGKGRARSISIKRLSKRDLAHGALLYPAMPGVDYDRPKTRAECEGAERPCPFVSCKHHLYLDVNTKSGSVKLNFPDLEVEDLPETCALDVADRGGLTLEETGDVMNLTRERIRQVEIVALEKLKALNGIEALDGEIAEYATEDHSLRTNHGVVKRWRDVT